MEKHHKARLNQLFSDLDYVLSSEPVPAGKKMNAAMIHSQLTIGLEGDLFWFGTDTERIEKAIAINERIKSHIQGIHKLPYGREIVFVLSQSPWTKQERTYDYTWIVKSEGQHPMVQLPPLSDMRSVSQLYQAMDPILSKVEETDIDHMRLRDLLK